MGTELPYYRGELQKHFLKDYILDKPLIMLTEDKKAKNAVRLRKKLLRITSNTYDALTGVLATGLLVLSLLGAILSTINFLTVFFSKTHTSLEQYSRHNYLHIVYISFAIEALGLTASLLIWAKAVYFDGKKRVKIHKKLQQAQKENHVVFLDSLNHNKYKEINNLVKEVQSKAMKLNAPLGIVNEETLKSTPLQYLADLENITILTQTITTLESTLNNQAVTPNQKIAEETLKELKEKLTIAKNAEKETTRKLKNISGLLTKQIEEEKNTILQTKALEKSTELLQTYTLEKTTTHQLNLSDIEKAAEQHIQILKDLQKN